MNSISYAEKCISEITYKTISLNNALDTEKQIHFQTYFEILRLQMSKIHITSQDELFYLDL